MNFIQMNDPEEKYTIRLNMLLYLNLHAHQCSQALGGDTGNPVGQTLSWAWRASDHPRGLFQHSFAHRYSKRETSVSLGLQQEGHLGLRTETPARARSGRSVPGFRAALPPPSQLCGCSTSSAPGRQDPSPSGTPRSATSPGTRQIPNQPFWKPHWIFRGMRCLIHFCRILILP